MGGIAYGLGDFLRRLNQNSGQDMADTAAFQEQGGVPGQVGRFGRNVAANFNAGMAGQNVSAGSAPPLANPAQLGNSLIPPQSEQSGIEQAIASRPSPDNLAGLRGGQFQGRPGFNSSIGGAGATANQLQRDTEARGMLEAKYAGEDAATAAEEERRGDPRRLSIEGALLNRAYEETQPYGSKSKIAASYGDGFGALSGTEVGSDAVGEEYMGAPTIGDARRQENLQRESLFKNMPEMRELEMRNSAMQKIQRLPEIAKAMKARGIPPADVDARIAAEERSIMMELTAASGKNLGFFGAGG